MKNLFLLLHITIAIGLMGLILLQSSQGGLSSSVSAGTLYRSKRGAERIIFISTIVLAGLFFITSVISLMLQ